MNAEISETMRARLLRFGLQIPELLTQRKFISVQYHADISENIKDREMGFQI